jgi:hypothetical protein
MRESEACELRFVRRAECYVLGEIEDNIIVSGLMF